MKRRDFLAVGSVGLTAALIPEWANSAQPCPPPMLSAAGGTTANTTCAPATPAGSVTTFTLTSNVTGTVPFTIGQPFKRGDVASGLSIVSDLQEFQADVRNRWSDGSVKYAVLSGRKSLNAGTPATVTVGSSNTAPGGTNITESALSALAPAVSMALSGFGTVTLATLLGSPVRSFLGPVMSEFHYRSGVGNDAHLAVWFFVRLYKGNALEIETCVENGYMKVAGAADKSYTATLTINGSSRYSGAIKHYARTRWMTINWYDGSSGLTDFARVVPAHNLAYLRSTKLIPNYAPSAVPPASYLSSVAQAIVPMGTGSLTPGSLAGAGYSDHIGIIPRWDAAYCVTGDARAFKSVVANVYAANTWPVAYRDEATDRPLALSTRPNIDAAGWNVDPVVTASTSNPNSFGSGTVAHMPGSGYLGYLITGRWTHLETLAFWAATTHMQSNPTTRGATPQNGGSASVNLSEDRGRAWAFRTQMMTISAYPDSGPTAADAKVRADWLAAMPATLAHWQAHSMNNNLGYPSNMYNPGAYSPGEAALPALAIPIWQGDFLAQCFGFAWDLDVLSGAGKASHQAVRDFLYKNPVGRMGDGSGWCYRQGLPYAPVVGTLDPAHNGDPNFIVWDSSWAAAWAHSAATATGSGGKIVDTSMGCSANATIVNGHMPEATSYGANFLPAIVYAVDHGAPGAAAAYARFKSAANYPDFVADQGSATQWAVLPRT